MQQAAQRKQQGVTLVELLVALAIIVVLGLAAARGYEAYENSRLKTVIDDLSVLNAEISGKYKDRATFNGLATALVAQSGLAPKSMVNGTTLTSSWGGAVTIAPENLGVADDSYSITIAGVPTAQCNKLSTNFERTARRIDIGSTTVKAVNGALNDGTLATQCAAAATADVKLYFGKIN